jgi:hypothetical protein
VRQPRALVLLAYLCQKKKLFNCGADEHGADAHAALLSFLAFLVQKYKY